MSTTGRADATAPAASEAAGMLRDAGLVRLVAAPDGDALAGAGVLARALADDGAAFQVSVSSGPTAGARSTDADVTVTLGLAGGDLALLGEPVSSAAYEIAEAVGRADATLTLAGIVAAGGDPGRSPTLLEAADLERRPGVAVPVSDTADGLAHTTLIHAPFSADGDAVERLLDEYGDRPGGATGEGGQRIASVVAVETVREAPPRAAHAVERALRPFVTDGPFATLGGYADVLDAAARTAPGVGVALALGHDVRGAALTAWREQATDAHRAVRSADTARHDGVTVAEVGDAPLGTVARLLRDFRAREPVAIATGHDAVAVAGTEDIQDPLRQAAAAQEAAVVGRGQTGRVTGVDPSSLVARFREAI